MDDAPTAWVPRMCVLASGSAGNCTAVVIGGPSRPRIVLIDAGLSPRRTRALLAKLGLSLEDVCEVIITHLDHDHWNAGWCSGLPARATVRMHRRHLGRAAREGMLHHRTEPFEEAFELEGGARIAPALLDHDSLGVVAFRMEFESAGTLGFATDVGRPTPRLIGHLRGVDVLAIESNYCPRLQAASSRPAFLKARIMGGAGHLSNAQCAEAAREIGPARHVVLLHLSRECNRPDLAAEGHRGAPYGLTISSQAEPTPWIDVAGVPRKRAEGPGPMPDKVRTAARAPEQSVLFA
ncbi:MAG: MBL fold metallo-hydrolase [Phycisphaerales bacterium]|nr:MBL fold metallo-hydrolase [Phycisphaerales bacterium]